jgi:hypothetical protein
MYQPRFCFPPNVQVSSFLKFAFAVAADANADDFGASGLLTRTVGFTVAVDFD